MKYQVIIDKDLRAEADYKVCLSDDLDKELRKVDDFEIHLDGGTTGSLIHFFRTQALDDHLLLIEQTNLTNYTEYFGIAHTIEEADKRLEARAMEYATRLRGKIERETDILPEIKKKFSPYIGWEPKK